MMNKHNRDRRRRKIRRNLYIIMKAPFYLTANALLWVKSKLKPLISSKNKLQNILNGWTNYIITDPVVEALAIKRAEICVKCPFVEEMTFLIKDTKIRDVSGFKCGKCNCPLSAKIRSAHDQCPIGKW